VAVSQTYNCSVGILRGDRILIERRTLDMNQEVLAAKIGVDRSYISRMERDGDVNVGIKTLAALADALGVSVPYLLGLSDDPLGVENPRSLSESHVVYEVDNATQRQRAQRILDCFLKLTPRDQDTVQSLADTLYNTQPRIIGNE
jgi:transcriptional regulator with XRE-family HTH domain